MFGARSSMVVRRSQFWICCALLISVIQAGMAGVGTWKNYTDMKSVRALSSGGGSVWAATSGGLFRFTPFDSSYQKVTTGDGLTTNDVTAVFTDADGRVWIGQASGAVDLYDPEDGSWRYITDIALSSRTNKSIRGFYAAGDRLYIAAAFGVAVFSMERFEFIDTYANFAGTPQPAVAAVTVFNSTVFAATDHGIVVSKTGALNLAAPESWNIFSSIATGNSFAVLNGEVYAGTGAGLLKYQGGSWINPFGITASVRIIGATDTSIVFAGSNMLRSVTPAGVVSDLSAPFTGTVTGGTMTADRTVYLGFNQNGIGRFDTPLQQWITCYPNGPYSNAFYQLVVDENNVVWCSGGGAGGTGNGKGFYSFDGTKWRNYNTGNTPLLLATDCFAVSLGPNNSKWVGTWGQGLMLIDGNGIVRSRFDNVHPGFVGIPSATQYTVPGGVAVDRSGAVWVTIFEAANRDSVVWKMDPDSVWTAYPGSPFGSQASFMNSVFIDNNNTKWFSNAVVGRGVGSVPLVFFNETQNLPNTSGGWGTISESDGLTSSTVYAVVQDRTGDLWLATANGITIITNPSNPADRITKVFLGAVRDLAINCIAVDALNNKWIGTQKGIFVLSPDGTQLLDQYSVENTGGKLVDNNVFSIAFDKKGGIAYFGTEKGLSSLEIVSVASSPVISSIDLSPNPVYLPDQQQVEIRGLVDESTIKVLSVNGKVLRQFPAQGGGRAFWDCKDGVGNRVASGIYIIVAHDRTGTQVGRAKIAVIRR